MTPIASIDRQRAERSHHLRRSQIDRRSVHELMLKALALLIAHGLAMITVVLSILVWNDWRSPDQTVQPWLVLALACSLCLNPFAVLGVSAVLASPSDAIRAIRFLAPGTAFRWLQTLARRVRWFVR